MRRAGWEMALRAAGKEVAPRAIAVGDWTPQSGEQAFYALLAAYPEMDAVFVSNDQMAMGAIRAATDLNVRIPEDIAMAGFDDIPEAAFTQPRLTTIRQPVVEIGRLSVVKLTERIADPDEAAADGYTPAALLQPKLIVRASSQRRKQDV